MPYPPEVQKHIDNLVSSASVTDFESEFKSVVNWIFATSGKNPTKAEVAAGCALTICEKAYNAWSDAGTKKEGFHTGIDKTCVYALANLMDILTAEVEPGLNIIGALFNLNAATTLGAGCAGAVKWAREAVTAKYGAGRIVVRAETAVCKVANGVLTIGEM